MFDPTQGEAAARELLNNPSTPAEDLAVIAGAFPALAPQIAAHPNLYPGLADWIKALGDPEADAALAARDGAAAADGGAHAAQAEAEAAIDDATRIAPRRPATEAAQPAQEPAAQPQPQAQTPAQPEPQYQPYAAPQAAAPQASPYQPPMASGPQQAQQAQQPQQPQQPQWGQPQPGQAPYGAGYQPYPGPGAPSGTQRAPEAKKGGKGKLIGIIAAAVVVVLVAAGAGWFFFLRDGGGSTTSSTYSLAPDFKDKPQLGDEIEADKLLEGDYYSVEFDRFTDASHVVVVGAPDTSSLYSGSSNWYEGYDEDYDQGYEDGEAYLQAYEEWWDCYDDDCPEYPEEDDYYQGSYDNDGYDDGWEDGYYEWGYGDSKAEAPETSEVASAIGLVDLDGPKLDWSVDLIEKTGFDIPQVSRTLYSDAGILAVQVTDAADGDEVMILAIDSNGEVKGTRDDESLRAAAGDYFLVADDDDISAVKATAFDEEVWTAEVNSNGTQVLSPKDGTYLVSTDDGFVNVADGTELGWGDEAGGEYGYTAPGDGIVLQFEQSSGSTYNFMRIDAETGEDKWDSEVKKVKNTSVALAGGKLIMALNAKVVAIDPGSGEEEWSVKVSDLSGVTALPSGNVLAVSGSDSGNATMTVLKAKNGEEVTEVSKVSTYYGTIGTDVMYAVDGDKLVAYDLTGDSTKALWKLDLETDDDYSLYVFAREKRLWLEYTIYDGDYYDGPSAGVLREIVK
ncbi:MAG: PQQ-binding-like beta-propeller repeat protein [Bifidobacteriaceae bacterium]|jgi:hypothetical protein|nr:PQQ-binding-like beta-propeller repeat protein [Bifidobacteriaceae bacterium]